MEFNGFTVYVENKVIQVKEDTRNTFFLRRCLQFIWIVNGLFHLLLFIETKDKNNLVIFFIGLIFFVLFIMDLGKSYEIKIAFEEIKEIKYKKVFWKNTFCIRLKNNKTQMIYAELSKDSVASIRAIFEENEILVLV